MCEPHHKPMLEMTTLQDTRLVLLHSSLASLLPLTWPWLCKQFDIISNLMSGHHQLPCPRRNPSYALFLVLSPIFYYPCGIVLFHCQINPKQQQQKNWCWKLCKYPFFLLPNEVFYFLFSLTAPPLEFDGHTCEDSQGCLLAPSSSWARVGLSWSWLIRIMLGLHQLWNLLCEVSIWIVSTVFHVFGSKLWTFFNVPKSGLYHIFNFHGNHLSYLTIVLQ
jgi:hypothetical protein